MVMTIDNDNDKRLNITGENFMVDDCDNAFFTSESRTVLDQLIRDIEEQTSDKACQIAQMRCNLYGQEVFVNVDDIRQAFYAVLQFLPIKEP